MPDELKDITEVVLKRSELPRDVAAIRKKCLTLPMVSECDTELTSFKGRPNGSGGCDVLVTGSIRIRTSMKVGISFDAEGSGQIDGAGESLLIKDVRIVNDFQGLLNRLLQISGLVAGRSLRLRPSDSAVIRAALAA